MKHLSTTLFAALDPMRVCVPGIARNQPGAAEPS
jgi:hypothetical protein